MQGQAIAWPMVVSAAVTTVLNILSNYILIVRLDLGFHGAAVSTALANWWLLISLCITIVLRRRYVLRQRANRSGAGLNAGYVSVALSMSPEPDSSLQIQTQPHPQTETQTQTDKAKDKEKEKDKEREREEDTLLIDDETQQPVQNSGFAFVSDTRSRAGYGRLPITPTDASTQSATQTSTTNGSTHTTTNGTHTNTANGTNGHTTNGYAYEREHLHAHSPDSLKAQLEMEMQTGGTQLAVDDPENTWPALSREVLRGWFEFLKLGLPGAASVFIEWGSYEISASVAGQLGDIKLAAHTVFMNTASFWFVFCCSLFVS